MLLLLRQVAILNINFLKIKLYFSRFNRFKKIPRRLIFILGLVMLTKELLKNKNSVVFCFQANIYCIYLCKLLNVKIIVRSGSSPTGWPQNPFKKIIYKNAYSLATKLIVNSRVKKYYL